MAKKPKAAKAGANDFDGEKAASFIRKIEAFKADMASEQGAYMARCRAIRESINVVYTEADALGFPRKELKTHVDLRALEVRKRNLVSKLEDAQIDTFERLAESLGDFAALPLGAATVQREAAVRDADPEDGRALDNLLDAGRDAEGGSGAEVAAPPVGRRRKSQPAEPALN